MKLRNCFRHRDFNWFLNCHKKIPNKAIYHAEPAAGLSQIAKRGYSQAVLPESILFFKPLLAAFCTPVISQPAPPQRRNSISYKFP